jgi:hypothetical protein
MNGSLPAARKNLWRFVCLLLCCAAGPIRASAQGSTARIPVCAKEFCQEMVIYATVLDSLFDHADECKGQPAAVLRTLHSAPYSWRDGRSGSPLAEPRSPVLGRIDDGPDPFRRFGDRVQVLDAEPFASRNLEHRCRFIFSPITWLNEAYVRVVVLEIWPDGVGFAELYLYLRRADNGWTIALLEDGMVS